MTDETITTDNTSCGTFYIVYMYLLTDTCITCMYLFSRGVPIICEDVWQSLAEKRYCASGQISVNDTTS